MRSPKKTRRPSQTPVVMMARDVTKLKQQVSDRVLCLVTAYLMDELDYDEDKIVEMWEGISRYAAAIDDHTITLNKVKEIIQEHTGIKFLGWKK